MRYDPVNIVQFGTSPFGSPEPRWRRRRGAFRRPAQGPSSRYVDIPRRRCLLFLSFIALPAFDQSQGYPLPPLPNGQKTELRYCILKPRRDDIRSKAVQQIGKETPNVTVTHKPIIVKGWKVWLAGSSVSWKPAGWLRRCGFQQHSAPYCTLHSLQAITYHVKYQRTVPRVGCPSRHRI